jgi:hypothetical protein
MIVLAAKQKHEQHSRLLSVLEADSILQRVEETK